MTLSARREVAQPDERRQRTRLSFDNQDSYSGGRRVQVVRVRWMVKRRKGHRLRRHPEAAPCAWRYVQQWLPLRYANWPSLVPWDPSHRQPSKNRWDESCLVDLWKDRPYMNFHLQQVRVGSMAPRGSDEAHSTGARN